MKKNKKPMIIATSILSAVICSFTACGSSTNDKGDGGKYDPEAKYIVKDVYNGTHDFTATDTDAPFVRNGKCSYTVVLPENRGAALNRARTELTEFFKEATGVELRTVSESLYTDDGQGYISLGKTTLLENSGITVDEKALTEDGARIVTKGKNIYIFGGSEYGALYAVYDFLEIYFNFDVYYKDCYEIDKNVKNLNLKNFDVTDIPDLEFRSNGYYGLVTGDWKYRFRTPRTYGDITFPIHSVGGDPTSEARNVHNSLNWLPPEQFASSHPNWYNASKNQLCYTAGGRTDTEGARSEEYEKMLDAALDKAVATLKLYNAVQYPDLRILNFTQQDNFPPCSCDACIADYNKYGTYAASTIIFMNDLREKIDEVMPTLDEKYQRSNMTLTFFAYQHTEKAPSDSFEEMKLTDGVSVYLASSESFDYQASIYADSNTEGRVNVKNWGKLSGEIFLWTYSTKFSHYMYPVETQNFYGADAFTFFAANNVKLMYNQSQITQKGTATAWHNLKAYLDSKLEWDGTRSQDYYTNKYIDAMFGPAAENMKEIYKAVRLRAGVVKTMYNGHTLLSGTTNLENADMWPYRTIKSWLDAYDEAYAVLDTIKNSDPQKYKLYKEHIDAEWLSPAYMMLTMYGDNLTQSYSKELKDRFREAAKVTGITNTQETGVGHITSFINGF